MKNQIKIIGMVLIAFICFGSCEKAYVEPEKPHISVNVTERTPDSVAITGTWRISSFVLNSKQKAELFKDYIFKFQDNGTLTAVYQYKDFNGKWDKTRRTIKIDFGDMHLLSLLNNDWKIGMHSENHIELGTPDQRDKSMNNGFIAMERVMWY